MIRNMRYLALALLATGGCASMRGEGQSAGTSNPQAQQVQTQQQQSEKALDQAQQEQKKASEEAKQAAAAQQEVQHKQQELSKAQEKAQAEQQQATQAQAQANTATKHGAAQAQQSQQQAAATLSTQQKTVQSGKQLVSGQVLRASGDHVVVQPQGGGDPMTFRVTNQTQVQISGRTGTATELRQGEDARVAYQVSGTQPTAVTIQVIRMEGGTGTSKSSAGSGTSSSGQTTTP